MAEAFDDWSLLKAYASTRSQDAFARLVAKYADMVFHTALRRTHNYQLSEDVTQAVFIVLARNAKSLKRKGSLGAWLHKTALYASSSIARSESRRKGHERAAARAEAIASPIDNQTNDVVCAAIEEELHRLPAADRQLLALHYLEGHSMAQSAEIVGLSLEAARKRLSRALERLRTRLSRRGTVVSAAAVATTVGGLLNAPSHAVASLIGSTAIAGGENGNAFRLASDMIRAMRVLVLKKAAAMVSIILLVGIVGVAVAQLKAPAVQMAQSVAPATTRASLQLPQVIRNALVHNAAQLSPTITVEWATRATSPLSVEEYTKTMKVEEPLSDQAINSRGHNTATWQDGKYYWSNGFEPRESKYYRSANLLRITEYTIDGEFLYSGNKQLPRQGVSQMMYTRSPLKEEAVDEETRYASAEYFDLIGLPLPVRLKDFRQHGTCIPTILFLLDHGASLIANDEVELDGRKLVRLRLVGDNPVWISAQKMNPDELEKRLLMSSSSRQYIHDIVEAAKQSRQLPEKRIYTFYLDPVIGYALRRSEESYDGGALLCRAECDDFEKLKDRDVYFPRKCTLNEFTGSNIPGTYFKGPVLTRTFDVEAIKTERVPDEIFAIHYTEPGSTFIDKSGGRQTMYIVQEDGTLAEPRRRGSAQSQPTGR